MRTLTVRRTVAAAVVPVAVVLVAGCGGHSGNTLAPAHDPTPSAASPSPSQPASTRVSPAAFLGRLKHATAQISTARFTQTVDASGQRLPIRGVIDLTGSSPAVRMTLDLSGMGTPSQMLMVDRVVYIGVPGSGGTYYAVSLDDPKGPLASLSQVFDDFHPGAMTASLSPRTFARVLDRGVVTAGGRQLHHYTAVMRPGMIAHVHNLPATDVPQTATYDVWLDGQDRLARFRMRMGRSGTVSGTYSDYGLDAHIVAPPASHVVPLPTSGSIG